MASRQPETARPAPEDIDGMADLIEDMRAAETIEDWSFILQAHLKFKNAKISNNTGIFNIGSAKDCPNIDTKYCQVDEDSCYARRDEKRYNEPLAYRRRQEFLWDCLPPETFVAAFLEIVGRRENETNALRINESGDFRHDSDIIRVNRVAELLKDEGIEVYTYSASSYLDWSHNEHFTVNQSNDFADYGTRSFRAVPDESDIPADGIHCPNQRSDGEIKCGDCRICITPDMKNDVYIIEH